MGHRNTPLQQRATLEWANNFSGYAADLDDQCRLSDVREAFGSILNKYFALCALSRHKTASQDLVNGANTEVFRVRVIIERSTISSMQRACKRGSCVPDGILGGQLYGSSKKQGVSVRMPLSTCVPTRLCANACYAHDALDAAPNAMVRGAMNGFIADLYENGSAALRQDILCRLRAHTRNAVHAAENECRRLPVGWSRRPFIRFAHVGEMSAYPSFANALAGQVLEESDGRVDCVVYTRHRKACDLDIGLWVINFTLDSSSEERVEWIPKGARTVFSAFSGFVSPKAEVNFLEHHPWQHANPIGIGQICPATLPEIKERTCDAQRCNRCFRPVNIRLREL